MLLSARPRGDCKLFGSFISDTAGRARACVRAHRESVEARGGAVVSQGKIAFFIVCFFYSPRGERGARACFSPRRLFMGAA